VAVLAARVATTALSLWVDTGTRPVTTPIRPHAVVTPPRPDTAAVLASLGQVAPSAEDRGTRPSLRVWGVAMHGDERLAVIASADGTQHLHRSGDVVSGATIVDVTWEGVTIEADGRRLLLPLETRPAGDADAPAPPPRPEARTREIRQVSADSYLVDRALLLGEAGNMSSLLAQLRAVPEVEAGEPIGFRVFSIAKQSIFRQLGLRDGDVVRRVNGTTIHDPTALLSFLQGLGDETRIALDLRRGGQPATLVYDLR